jgi:hypothetical protein
MVLTLEREPRQKRRWGQLVARSWDDDAFRQRLLTEPEAVLREEGIDVPEGIAVRVVENDAGEAEGEEAYLRLPARPAADELVEDDLSLPQEAFSGPGHLKPTTCLSLPCGNCGHTHRSRPGKVTTLQLPAKPAADALVEDDLSLPLRWPNGPMNITPCRWNCARSRPS